MVFLVAHQMDGESNQFGGMPQVEFLFYPVTVSFDGFDLEVHCFSNLGGGSSLSYKLNDLELPIGEAPVGVRGPRGPVIEQECLQAVT